MAERRRFPRVKIAIEASYQAEGSVLGRRATLAALSACGASFVSEEPLDPGSDLEYLRFTLDAQPTPQTFRPAAAVLSCEEREGIGRSEEYLIGVEFKGLSLATTRQINDLVLALRTEEDPPPNPRIEIEKQVAVRFDRFDSFVEEVSKNLSRTGMFIRSERPQPAGSQFEFVLQLGDDFNMVQGRAEVVWTRPKQEGVDRPPGMGIRFLSLDKTSENVLLRLIGAHLEPTYPRALDSRAPADDAPDQPDVDRGEPRLQ